MSAPLQLAHLPGAIPLGRRSVVLVGDVLRRLADVPDGSVQCVVTSPPYWGLRDYGVAPTAWPEATFRPAFDLPPVTVPAMACPLGLEPDLLAFVAHLVLVFREVARVLRPDGVAWVNLGDSYATGTNAARKPSARTDVAAHAGRSQGERRTPPGLAAKNLLLQPHRAALALQADGWTLRNDDVWAKTSPVPESVTDRTTRSHEYVFQLTRGPRYFFDALAVAEPAKSSHSGNATRSYGVERGRAGDHRAYGVPWSGETRNPRSVWAVAAEPFDGAHFAAFPSRLALRCVLAATSEVGACPSCGSPWRRMVARGAAVDDRGGRRKHAEVRARQGGTGALATGEHFAREHVGWERGCRCPHARPAPCVVLDPFAGTGTALAVADALGHVGVGVEAQPAYVGLMPGRFADVARRLAVQPPAPPPAARGDGPLFTARKTGGT